MLLPLKILPTIRKTKFTFIGSCKRLKGHKFVVYSGIKAAL
jgi:hypothetical protein